MSDLQRSFAKAKLSNLPFNPPRPSNWLDSEDDEDYGHFDEHRYGQNSSSTLMEEDEGEEEGDDALKPLPSPSASFSAGMEDDSSSASSASSMSSTGTIMPSPSQKLFARGKAPQKSTSRFAPLPWTDFFAQELYLTPNDPSKMTHHIYLTSPTRTASAARPSPFTTARPSAKPSTSSSYGPLFIMHHGGGSSGLSFAAITAQILKQLPSAGVLAFDARGHGETHVPEDSPAYTDTARSPNSAPTPTSSTHPGLDFSLPALASDLSRVWIATRDHMGWGSAASSSSSSSSSDEYSTAMPVVLVGHSVGGAVVATVAGDADRLLPGARLLGFSVLDVVEGSAMDALQSMTAYLATRPRSFASVDEGVEWHLRSRTIRNATSAKASVPGLLMPEEVTGITATKPNGKPAVPAFSEMGTSAPSSNSVCEGASAANTEPPQAPSTPTENAPSSTSTKSNTSPSSSSYPFPTTRPRFTWRTDLVATQPFWEGWFAGLSSKFLAGRGGKLLLLAGTDRLDKELMIGQMQGKYQLQVIPEAGHFLHEDAPEKAAGILVDFYRRNDGSRLVLPPKVGDLLKRGVKV